MEEARVSVVSEPGKVRIINRAEQSNAPISPDVPRNLIMALIIGAMLGFGIKIAIEHFDNTDTTTINVGMLYMNDLNNPKKLYKYNLYNSTFQDTLEFNANIKEVQFY